MKTTLTALMTMSVAMASFAQEVQVRVGDVKDSRTTGQFFAGLEVELKLSGDGLDDAKSMRVTLKTATDDTGRNLLDAKQARDDFESVDGPQEKVTLHLKNPPRKATMVKEISGVIEFFTPKLDPESTAVFDGFLGKTNAPLQAPALAKAKVAITAYKKPEFEALNAKVQAEKKAKPKGIEAALADAFGGMFMVRDMNDNDVALRVEDPESKVVGIEFQDKEGKKVERNGRSSSKQGGVETMVYDFRTKLPEGAKMVVFLSTEKAMVKVPLALKEVGLP